MLVEHKFGTVHAGFTDDDVLFLSELLFLGRIISCQ